MELILNRYRNLTVLLVAIAAQLVLLAYQVKSQQDVRLIRVWSVTAITPLARLIEIIRGSTIGFMKDYFVLLTVREENLRLKAELDALKLDSQFLRSELSQADRVKSLAAFRERIPSKTIGARVIANATGANSKVVYVDRGTAEGVLRGMAVITPDGIVGKVIAAFPTASQVMLITDPSFAAGVLSDKRRVPGTLKGQGTGQVIVDFVPIEMEVEKGEKFYTSGDDRIFPKGLPVGEVTDVRQGRSYKEIFVAPSGLTRGLEEVLIVIEGVHQPLPDPTSPAAPFSVLPAPPAEQSSDGSSKPRTEAGTDADRLRERYQRITESQGVHLGRDYKVADFNRKPSENPPPKPPETKLATSPPAGPPAKPPASNDKPEAKPATATQEGPPPLP